MSYTLEEFDNLIWENVKKNIRNLPHTIIDINDKFFIVLTFYNGLFFINSYANDFYLGAYIDSLSNHLTKLKNYAKKLGIFRYKISLFAGVATYARDGFIASIPWEINLHIVPKPVIPTYEYEREKLQLPEVIQIRKITKKELLKEVKENNKWRNRNFSKFDRTGNSEEVIMRNIMKGDGDLHGL